MSMLARNDPLRLGMFVMPIHDAEKPLAQCYDEDLELAVRCEELGFHDFWVGEHHSSIYENIVMPEIFIAKALGMTRSLRFGPAPVCLQYHHPAHVANRLAFLDHLSHGRLNICFGPGAIPTDMELYGVAPEESGRRVAEAIAMVLDLWMTDPPYEMNGEFWKFCLKEKIDAEMGLGRLHKPFQRPHPPIYVPCISRGSAGVRQAAARGLRPISHHLVSEEVLADHWRTYQQGAAAAGRDANPSQWCVARNVLVADTTRDARRLARTNSLGKCITYILELTRRGPGLAMWKRNPEMTDEECNLDYFMEEVVIAGDPEAVARRIVGLREALGPFGTLVLVAHDWDDRRVWLRSLELFAREVIPRLSGQLRH
jgi:alkanesulfonate monooxygenase SsuD/methylene tetrahydromethanopterin reductase-like flavin-dependent oxidoreductase (luciferase family)